MEKFFWKPKEVYFMYIPIHKNLYYVLHRYHKLRDMNQFLGAIFRYSPSFFFYKNDESWKGVVRHLFSSQEWWKICQDHKLNTIWIKIKYQRFTLVPRFRSCIRIGTYVRWMKGVYLRRFRLNRYLTSDQYEEVFVNPNEA